jgi:predicted nucleic acid-binding Zn ribbon protein
MSFLAKLFGKKTEPKQRIRVCVECGMPIAEHKQWCSILRGQQEMDRKAQAQATAK